MTCVYRVYKGKEQAKHSAEKIGMLYSCSGCKSFSTQPLAKIICEDKSTKYKPATGPPVDMKCSICGWTHHLGQLLPTIHNLQHNTSDTKMSFGIIQGNLYNPGLSRSDIISVHK